MAAIALRLLPFFPICLSRKAEKADAEVFMCLNMLFSGSGQLKPLFNSDITAEQGPTLEAERLGHNVVRECVCFTGIKYLLHTSDN